jgi:acyl-CoA reductase-like NAD-dependent aldehyde dehydrogenase
VSVLKTYKLFVGGKFPRSESGRTYEVADASGGFLANAARASRKDVRDAVTAARTAFGGWSGATAYNRGQVLYRVAEIVEGRREQFAELVVACEDVSRSHALSIVDATVDRTVWYAGWTDKIATVLGSANPVAGPYFSFTVPEPTGVVGILAPQRSSLLGLLSVLAPALACGNTAVVVASAERALPAITLSEALATSDIPAGVVNILTGYASELGPWLASHADVNALDLIGAAPGERADLRRAAADTVTRVLPDDDSDPDWTRDPGIGRLRAHSERKTVWHPKGT